MHVRIQYLRTSTGAEIDFVCPGIGGDTLVGAVVPGCYLPAASAVMPTNPGKPPMLLCPAQNHLPDGLSSPPQHATMAKLESRPRPLRQEVGSPLVMNATASRSAQRVRTAELAAALCLATDLGMGFPFEHGLHRTLIAMRLADRLEVDEATASLTYFAGLLMYSGCTADAETQSETFGGSMTTHFVPVMFGSQREIVTAVIRALPPPGASGPRRAIEVARRLPRAGRGSDPHMAAICDVARMLAGRLGLPDAVGDLFVHLTDRWDGKGPLGRAGGEKIARPLRIAHVASDAAVQSMLSGEEQAVRIVAGRGGRALDPEIVDCLVDCPDVVALERTQSAWDEVLAAEPGAARMLEGEAVDRGLAAIGDFADLVSPYLTGHSRGVAELAGRAAVRCGLDADGVRCVRGAAFLHDIGRVAVDPGIWHKRAALSPDEWEQVRLHPYQTQRVLSRSPFLLALAPIAAADHERLDGSGYHRGVSGAELPTGARLLAAADAYAAMAQPRGHRGAMGGEQAAREIIHDARAGRLDADAVTAVVEAAGQPAPRIERPGGLTEREVEVVRALARGLQTKQVARDLGISVKTADRHVQNAYRKIGASSRAATTLFAMEHGLLAWGELPMDGGPPAT